MIGAAPSFGRLRTGSLAAHSCFEGEGGGEYSWTGFPIRLGMTKGFGFLNSAGEEPFFILGVF